MSSLDSQLKSKLDELYEQYKRDLYPKLYNRSQDLPSDSLASASTETVSYHPSIQDDLEESLRKLIHSFTETLSNSINNEVNLSPRINTTITNYISETERELVISIINQASNHGANITADILQALNLEHDKVLEFFETTPPPNYTDQSEKGLIDLLKNSDSNISEHESSQHQTDLTINNSITVSIKSFYSGIINQIKILIDGTTTLHSEIDLKTLSSLEQKISIFLTTSSSAAATLLSEISDLLFTKTTQSYSHAREVLERRKGKILQAVGLKELIVTNNSSSQDIHSDENDPKPQPPEPPLITDIFDPDFSQEEFNKFLKANNNYYNVKLREWEARHPEKASSKSTKPDTQLNNKASSEKDTDPLPSNLIL